MTQNYLSGVAPKINVASKIKLWLYRFLDEHPKHKGYIEIDAISQTYI
jgi:hypothetical protein